MPRPANPKTPEGAALTQAIPASGFTQAQLAEKLDVTPGFISQFASGHRPVPWDKAATLAPLLGLQPNEISADYRRMQDHFGASQPQRPDFEIMSGTVTLLRAYLVESRQPPEFIEDPIMLGTAYEVVMEFGQPVTSANVIDLTKILEEKVRSAINGQDQVRGTGKKAGGKKR